MFLFRIGKEKLAYTLTMNLQKIRYSQLKTLPKDSQFKIDIKRQLWGDIDRGSHELTFISLVGKKGKIIYDSKPQSIPMTLYFDADQWKFNKKDMVIQTKILNDLGEQLVDFDEVELDIAQNASVKETQEFDLDVQLQADENHLCRNLGQNSFTTEQPHKTQLKSQVNKIKAHFPTQISSVSKKQLSEDNSLSNCLCMTTPNSKIKKTQISKQYLTTIKESSPRQKQESYQENDTVILKKNNLKNLQSQEESLALKLFQTEKMLKNRQNQLSRVKKQLEDQKAINKVFLQKQEKQVKYNESKHLAKQVQLLQTQLQVAKMRIFHLESQNKSYLQQVQTVEADVFKLNQQTQSYRVSLEHQKMKIAELIQKAFQSGNIHLLNFIESTLITQQ